MNKYRLILSLVIIATTTIFAFRHRSLNRLKSENAERQQRAEETVRSRSIKARTNAASVAATEPGLSPSERSELLRLRGEIGPLRKELAQETNRMTRTNANSRHEPLATNSDQPVVSREEMMIKMNQGRQWMLALILHADKNGGKLPVKMSDAAKFAGGAEGADNFEMVFSGDFRSVNSPGTTIVFREKKPWKGANGRWSRGYAFADGHVQFATSPSEDFTDWEQKLATQPETISGN